MESELVSAERYRQCSFIRVQKRLPSRILKSDVHILDSTTKNYLFRFPSTVTNKQKDYAAKILERLRSISPTVTQSFEIKSNEPERMTLRLLNQGSNSTEVENSYVALSYCWKPKNRVPGTTLVDHVDKDEYPLPVSPPLFQALLAECRSAREGIWCDQICINQEDEVEKAVAISAMDIVYRCARIVVVALDDIEISVEEQSLLLHYIESDRTPKSPLGETFEVQSETLVMESDPVFRGLFEKILGARWFSRAWCAYEMRLASNHLFLIRCTTEDEVVGTVFRFNGSFLSHLLALAIPVKTFKTETYDLLPALIGTFGALDDTESETYHQVEVDLLGIEEKLSLATSYSERQSLEAQRRHLRNELEEVLQLRSSLSKTPLRVFLEVFELKAGGDPRLPQQLREQNANEDKMSIVLNTIASGLIYRRPPGMQRRDRPSTVDECCRKLLLLAFAMRDPIVLCTTGQPLRLDGSGTLKSWLSWPEMSDIQDNLPPMSLLDISVDPGYMTQYVRLDLLFLGRREHQQSASEMSLSIAKDVIVQFARSNRDEGAHLSFWDYVNGDNTLLIEREAQILACMLDCGESWTSTVSTTCGYADNQVLQASLPLFFQQIHEIHGRNDMSWLKTKAGNAAVGIMLDFAYYVALIGIPWFAINDDAWKPTLICVEDNNPILIFSSMSPQNKRNVEPAVPTAVLADAYERLPRVWILRHRQNQCYELLGKSRMFGGASIVSKRNDMWQRREKQFVYGPQDPNESRWIPSVGASCLVQ